MISASAAVDNPRKRCHQKNCDWIMFTVQHMDQIDTQQLKAVLTEAKASLVEEQLAVAGA